jgi:hypothetical protein
LKFKGNRTIVFICDAAGTREDFEILGILAHVLAK